MRHIKFSENTDVIHRRLPFFLATEEWVARRMPAGEYFFSWQVDPTVICGRNQDIKKEVNLDYCRKHGIDVVRRRSGGGAVFADRENFMFSFITHGDDITEEFARYTSMIAGALNNIGIKAEATGRNDIIIDGKKVSGNAFYHIPGRCIAHGTMLYNFDINHISKALTPSRAKIESKGVKSVESRVTCLKAENITLSTEEFESHMINTITSGMPYMITNKDLEEIEEIELRYYDPAFLKIENDPLKIKCDKNINALISKSIRLEGIGEFSIEYRLDSDTRIRDFSISGDFFMKDNVESRICRPLEGISHDMKSISEAIKKIDPASVIPGLTDDKLINLII